MHRLMVALTAVALLVLPAGVPASVGAKAPQGLSIKQASYDAGSGVVRVDMRWNERELRREGDGAGHLVVLGRTGDAVTVVHDERIELTGKAKRRHEIVLTADERAQLAESAAVEVAATHKHDDDGGLYDRAWYDVAIARTRAGTDAAMQVQDPRGEPSTCEGPFGPRVKLVYCHLQGANLSGMDLTWAVLTFSDLQGANLSGANLSNTDMGSVDATGVNLSSANLTGALLPNANLAGAAMSWATVDTATFDTANLSGVNLDRAMVHGSFFGGANLSGAQLTNMSMESSNLIDADLAGAQLSNMDLRSSKLMGANLAAAQLTNTNLETSDLTGANLSNSDWYGSEVVEAVLENADLSYVRMESVGILDTNLRGANLSYAKVAVTLFNNADLTGAITTGWLPSGNSYCKTTMPDGTVNNAACPPRDSDA